MVSSAVRRAAKNLEVLRTFAWDGEELPPYDDMWFALRMLCVPFVISPGVSAELELLINQLPPSQVHFDLTWFNPTPAKQPCTWLAYLPHEVRTLIPPQLFDFIDLYGFSLTFKTGFYWQNDGVFRGSQPFSSSG